MILRELVARIGLDFDQKAYDKADKAIHGFKSALGSMAGLLTASGIAFGLKKIVMGAAQAADAVGKTATRLGVSAQAFQELGHAAELSDVGMDGLAMGLQYLARNASEAASGSKSASEVFKRLGVNVRDAHGKVLPSEELFNRVADGMARMTNDTERVNVAMQLFGRGGGQMINMLKDGRAGIEAMRQEARDLGGIFDADFIGQSEQVNDDITRLKAGLNGLRIMVARTLLPPFIAFVQTLIGVSKWVQQALRGTALLQTASYFLAAAGAIAAFTMGSRLLGALGAVSKASALAALGFQTAGDKSLGMQLKAMLLGARFIVLIAVIALLGEEIVGAFQGKDTLFKRLGDAIASLQKQFMEFPTDSPLVVSFKALALAVTAVKDGLFAIITLLSGGGLSGFDVMKRNFDENAGGIEKGMKQAREVEKEEAKRRERAAFWARADQLQKLRDAAESLRPALVPLTAPQFVTRSAGSVAAGGPVSIVSSPQSTINMNVQTQEGQSPQAFGVAAASKVEDAWSKMHERTLYDMLPAMPAPVPGQ